MYKVRNALAVTVKSWIYVRMELLYFHHGP